MQFAVPGTMLLATTSVYGRMASYNEIVAVKSLGISPMVLVWPTLILATLVSFVAVVLNDVAVSWGTTGRATRVPGVDRRGHLRPAAHAAHLQPGQSQHHGPRRRGPPADLAHADHAIVRRPAQHGPSPPTRPSCDLLPDEGKLVVRFHNFELTGRLQLQRSRDVRIRDLARGVNRLDRRRIAARRTTPWPRSRRRSPSRSKSSRASSKRTSPKPRSAC